MRLHRLGDRAEDDAGLGKLLLEGRDDRDGIEHRIDRDAAARLARPFDAGEDRPLVQRNAELLVDLQELGIDLVERLRPRGRLRRGVIIEILIVDRR